VVLTSADGQSVYGKSMSFFEDLAMIEESLNAYDLRFRNHTNTSENINIKRHQN